MATSGITTYQISRDALITAAIRKLGVIAAGQSPTAQDITDAGVALNMLVGQLRSIGMPLWARKTYTFNPVANQQVYPIGNGTVFNVPYPIHVLQAYRQDSGSTTRISMEVIPNFNLNLYPTTSGGTPIQLSYQPFINYGEISVWPVPDSSATSSTITIVYQSPFQYFNSAADTMDFPEEWYLAIVYGLASLIAPEWGTPLQDRQVLAAEADKYLKMAKENGQEDGSMFIQPNRRQ
jgi:hypothetical protein